MTKKMFSISLNEDQIASIEQLLATSLSETFEEELAQCVKYGIENRVYRQKYNKKQNLVRKMEAAELDTLRAKLAAIEAAK